MNAKFIIPGRLPGLNEYTKANRTGHALGARMKKETEEIIFWAIKAARIKPFSGIVTIQFRWIEKDTRRDKDNIAFAKKFIQDALVKANVLRGDGWKYIKGFADIFEIDKANPRVEVEIEES